MSEQKADALQTLSKLADHFDPDVVQMKPAYSGGKPMPYVSHGLVTKRLNARVPGWCSRILGREVVTVPVVVNKQRQDKTYVEVTLEVSLPDGSYHQEVGAAEVGRDYGTAVKAAASDALKRAAMRFGVALYLWETLEEGEEEADPTQGWADQIANAETPAELDTLAERVKAAVRRRELTVAEGTRLADMSRQRREMLLRDLAAGLVPGPRTRQPAGVAG